MFYFLGLGFQQIFLFAGIIAFFSVVPLLWVKETGKDQKKITFRKGIGSLSFPLKILIFSSAVFALGNFGYMFFVLRSQSAFTAALAIAAPIALYTVYQVASSLSAYPAGRFSDRVGQKKLLIFAYILYIFTNLGFIFFHGLFFFLLLFVMFGVVYAVTDSMQRAFVSNISDEDYKGTSLGAYHFSVGLAALPGGIIAGHLWGLSQELTFLFGIAATVVALVALYFVKEAPV